ncbi:hypothetical protein DUK53_14535 [Listeria sp. SHR_NRA_18]|uniref:hypothetical protein n=1 Tax=Listeria sp. SHR_NRA_18 TaxID=2269046 RepID=UPI000F5F9707|nr:hypothetical protein [Listeria sp. SHR_NRA_18]RQW65828.1 hypothetical protein DUK53_14535 [Listeria sp. SHR_NRA_18]
MKTSEFKQAVEELGYSIGFGGASEPCFSINNRKGTLAFVEVYKVVGIDTTFGRFEQLSDAEKQSLGALLFEYAATPLDEREPERKWYLRDPVISDESFNYLKINRKTGTRTYGEKYDYGDNWQTSYTRAEIEAFTFSTEHLIEDEVSE